MNTQVSDTNIPTRSTREAINMRHRHVNMERLENLDDYFPSRDDLNAESEARRQAIAAETTSRTQAITNETTARTAAINAANNRIDTTAADITSTRTTLDTHTRNLNNPHSVTLGQLNGASLAQLQAVEAGAAPITHVGATGNAHGNATPTTAGFISAQDKTKLDGIQTGATAGGDSNFVIARRGSPHWDDPNMPAQPEGFTPPKATRNGTVAVGYGSFAGIEGDTTHNPQNWDGGQTAIGFRSRAIGSNSTTVGAHTTADGHSTAIGSHVTATEHGATAIGSNSTASGSSALAIGRNAMALNTTSTAIGASARATRTDATAIGRSTTASADRTVAIGNSTTAQCAHDVVSGTFAHSNMSPLTQIQANDLSIAGNNSVYGGGAGVYGLKTSAFGAESRVGASNNRLTGSSAIGPFAIQTHQQSVLLTPNNGANNRNSHSANQILFGYAGINVAGFSAYSNLSDGRDKTDISDLQFDALEFINNLKPRQYRMDERQHYVRYRELSAEEFNKLDTYTQRHECIIETVQGLEGTNIEWINNHSLIHCKECPEENLRPQIRKMSTDKYLRLPQFISNFVLSYDEAVETWLREQPQHSAFSKITAELDEIDELGYQTTQPFIIAEKYELQVPEIIDTREAYFLRIHDTPDGTHSGKRYHPGFVAQEVIEAAENTKGLKDFAGIKYLAHNKDADNVPMGDDMYMISYESFIAPMIAAIQQLSKRNDELEARLVAIEGGANA